MGPSHLMQSILNLPITIINYLIYLINDLLISCTLQTQVLLVLRQYGIGILLRRLVDLQRSLQVQYLVLELLGFGI